MKTSSNQMNAKISDSLWDDLTIVLSDIKKQDQMSEFLKDFLTDTEKSVLMKRLGILKRLYSNYSYEEIQSELQVSSATVSSVAKIKDQPAANSAIEKLAVHAWADQLAQKVIGWFN